MEHPLLNKYYKLYIAIFCIIPILMSCSKTKTDVAYDIKVIEPIDVIGNTFFSSTIEVPYWYGDMIFENLLVGNQTENRVMFLPQSKREISYVRLNAKKQQPIFCKICIDSTNRAAYFSWINKNISDTSKHPEFDNAINDHTIELISNCELKTIQELFPKFKGKYKKVKIDSIVLTDEYHVSDLCYYFHSTFYGYKEKGNYLLFKNCCPFTRP